MAIARYILSFLFKNIKWLITIPLLVGLLLYYFTLKLDRKYEANTVIYTGIVSGFTIDGSTSSAKSYLSIENALDNLKSIIKSQTTLEEVCLTLFANSMMYGNPDKDNTYITAESFRKLWDIVPMDVKALIVKDSLERTIANLRAYKTDDSNNFIYGLIYYEHPDYSVKALSNIDIIRRGSSDMLDIRCSSYDPALAYQTVLVVSDVFKKKYKDLQFKETNDVIEHFQEELAKYRAELNLLEDSLMLYKQKNKIIEYDQQTREIASMDAELQKARNQSELSQSGSESALGMLDGKVQDRNNMLGENSKLMGDLSQESALVEMISRREMMLSDSLAKKDPVLARYRKELDSLRKSLKTTTASIGSYETSADGMLSPDILSALLLERITAIKSNTEVGILTDKQSEMDTLYSTYSVVGANLKRMEREIKVAEHSYLNVLDNINEAYQRQKNLQISSASLQVITPAVFPVGAIPSKRKQIVFGGTFGAFVFLLTLFLLLDLVPTTLSYPEKAERLIRRKIFGSFPLLKSGDDESELEKRSTSYLCKAISVRVEPGNMLVVNLLSVEREQGKTFLADKLTAIFEKRGYSVKTLRYERDFDQDSRMYDHAGTVVDLMKDDRTSYDLVIVEHPSMVEKNIPKKLLCSDSLNLLVCMRTLAWTHSYSMALDKLDATKTLDIEVLLNGVDQQTMESYIGLIAPASWLRRFKYNLINLDFRSLVIDMLFLNRPKKTV